MTNWFGPMFRVAALMAVGGSALLQAGEPATFHLSVVTHWGGATLQPGDYTMSLPNDGIGQHQLKVEGEGKTVCILPIVADLAQEEGGSHLDLTESHGDFFVQDFYSSAEGKEYRFSVPKRKNRLDSAASLKTTSIAVK